MPPQTGSRKARQSANPKQSGRPVIPAIPLPHVKRQAAAAAAAVATKPPSTPKPAPRDERAVSADQGKSESPTDSTGHSSEPVSDVAVTKPSSPITVSESDSSPVVQITLKRAGSNRRATEEVEGEITPHKTLGVVNAPKPLPQDHSNGADPPFQTALSNEHNATSPSMKPQVVPPLSPARYQMPPNAHPGQSLPGRVPNGAGRGQLFQDPVNVAQAQLGNGHARFGSFSVSGSSSPAPHAGGIAPPPGMPLSNGIPTYPAPERAEFLPVMPYVRDGIPIAGFNNYGGGSNAPSSVSHHQPYHVGHIPSPAAQNYQDSQSSATQEEIPGYQQASHNGAPPDGVPPVDAQSKFFGGSEHSGWMPSHIPPPGMVPHIEESQGLILHTQQQFGSPEFADCALELRQRGGIPTPSGLPAHRLVLSRSPVLKDLIHKQGTRPGPVDQPWFSPLVLETDNQWVRPDSFYLAVQNLYGFPLFRVPLPNRGPEHDGTVTGTIAERLHFALSYAAAGHILGWGPVVRRGCEIACQLLDAATVEMVMEFALEDYCDKGAYEEFKYGDGSAALLHAVAFFVISNLHPSFRLDTSATSESRKFARLPLDSAPTPKAAEAAGVPPVIARGSSVAHLKKGVRHQSHPSIQFGDLDIANGQDVEGHQGPESFQRVSDTIVSRILLNLPFGVLKMLIETGLERAHGWANPGARYRLVQEIVGEREARRARSLNAVVSETVPDAAMIRESLGNPEPRVPRWGALGWHEEVTTRGDSDGLVLQRQWTPFKSPQTDGLTEFP